MIKAFFSHFVSCVHAVIQPKWIIECLTLTHLWEIPCCYKKSIRFRYRDIFQIPNSTTSQLFEFEKVTEPQFFLFLLFVWPRWAACGIVVPQPGIEPGPQQWKRQVLTTRLPGNSHEPQFLKITVSTWNTFIGEQIDMVLSIPEPTLWQEWEVGTQPRCS